MDIFISVFSGKSVNYFRNSQFTMELHNSFHCPYCYNYFIKKVVEEDTVVGLVLQQAALLLRSEQLQVA